MASVQITTTDQGPTITHGRAIEKAGSRLYAIVTTNAPALVYYYSDDDGATWSSPTTVSNGGWYGTLFYDSVNNRLNIVAAGGNNGNVPLQLRAITTNVTTGVPGALTTATTIDAGGTSLGIQYPYAFHSASTTNPRYWIIAKKWTGASNYETRVWYCAAGSSADTAANWSTTNFTNLSNHNNANHQKMGVGAYWKVGGADKVTLYWEHGDTAPYTYRYCTFNPTVTTPTPGTITQPIDGGSTGLGDPNQSGSALSIAARDDYLILGRNDTNVGGTYTFWYTTNGTSWTAMTTGSVTAGRAQIAKSNNDFYAIHTGAWTNLTTSTPSTLSYRKLTTSTNTVGAATTFSDTTGAVVSVPSSVTTKLFGIYRGSASSPYTVRTDNVSIQTSQFLRPASTITVNNWRNEVAGVNLHTSIDETIASDSDFIQSGLSPVSPDIAEVKFSAGIDPNVSNGHIIRYRIKKDSAGGDPITMVVRLVQGTTIKKTWTHSDISDTVITYEQTLSGAEADSITDYTDLRLRFEATSP